MLEIDKLALSVGSFALQDVSLAVDDGEYFVLLGPSGSGKTLFLESLCGLARIDSGRIVLDGIDITKLEPRHRRIGYVPQDYALFPHRTVRRNVAFGRRRSVDRKGEVDVDQLLERTGIAHLADRKPARLSGGEKQRVALARALAITPRLLLLDEPVSALDELTREEILPYMKTLHRQIGAMTIHVCHNFSEMMAVADRVGLIFGGKLLQVGTPREILERPRTVAAARFVGMKNIFGGQATTYDRYVRLETESGEEFWAELPDRPLLDHRRHFGVRAEHVHLVPGGAGECVSNEIGVTRLPAVVRSAIDQGSYVSVATTVGSLTIHADVSRSEFLRMNLQPGDTVTVVVEAANVCLLDSDA
ncbi:MAG: ATP-binding cassette domain-containing protein [Planctomycetota bacterium]|nr:MAG: ATP-binding cassette domain-containing protein [Planctomycetota bacterium]